MIRIVPLRLMTWQNSHLRFTEALTFIVLPASNLLLVDWIFQNYTPKNPSRALLTLTRPFPWTGTLVKLSLNFPVPRSCAASGGMCDTDKNAESYKIVL